MNGANMKFEEKRTSRAALTSFFMTLLTVLGLIGIFVFILTVETIGVSSSIASALVPFVVFTLILAPLVGLITAAFALIVIRRHQNELKGKGFATASLGILGLYILVLLIGFLWPFLFKIFKFGLWL